MRCPFWTGQGVLQSLGAVKSSLTQKFPTRVCPALLLVQTQRCFGGLLAPTAKNSNWSHLGIPPARHFGSVLCVLCFPCKLPVLLCCDWEPVVV